MLTTFFATLTPMLTLFICIAVGFILKRCRILPDNAGKVMAKLETWVFCPALSFSTMMKFCTRDRIAIYATNVLLSLFGVVLAMLIAILIAKLFAKKDDPEHGVYMYALAFANSGYMGDPIVEAVYSDVGDLARAYYKAYCLPITIAIYTWGIATLVPKDKRQKGVLKKLINPPTVALFLGMIVGLSGLGEYMPAAVVGSLDQLKACMGPVAMLLAGFTIATYSFKDMIKKRKVYVASVLRLVVIPAVIIAATFGVKELMNFAFDLSIGNTVLFLTFFAVATPLGLNTVVFPEAYGGTPETGASMTMISHTLCILSIPLMYSIMVAVFGAPIF